MVAKTMFESFAAADREDNYFLRQDRILGAFLLDPDTPLSGVENCADEVAHERQNDKGTKEALQLSAQLKEIEAEIVLEVISSQNIKDESNFSESINLLTRAVFNEEELFPDLQIHRAPSRVVVASSPTSHNEHLMNDAKRGGASHLGGEEGTWECTGKGIDEESDLDLDANGDTAP
jgi:hypothetical protein